MINVSIGRIYLAKASFQLLFVVKLNQCYHHFWFQVSSHQHKKFCWMFPIIHHILPIALSRIRICHWNKVPQIPLAPKMNGYKRVQYLLFLGYFLSFNLSDNVPTFLKIDLLGTEVLYLYYLLSSQRSQSIFACNMIIFAVLYQLSPP